MLNSTNVNNQTNYEHISSNQCSWFVYCFLNKIKLNKWIIPDGNLLIEMYNNALLDASNFRKQYGKYSWGESIFSKIIYDKFQLDISSPKNVKIGKTFVNNNGIMINSMEDIHNYKLNLDSVSINELKKTINELCNCKKFMMINRYGQSFILYPKDNFTFYIFDSHTTSIKIFNNKEVYDYIGLNNEENFIIFIVGNMNDCVLNDTSFLYN